MLYTISSRTGSMERSFKVAHWSMPSRPCSEGVSPAAESKVGNQSVTWVSLVEVEAGCRTPGAVTEATVLVPPSHKEYLPPLRGQLLAA